MVVAGLVEGAEIEPDLGYVGINADGAGVGIECVAVLVYLEVEDTDRTPEGGIATIAVYGLLVGFVGLVVFLASHIGATEEVPTLRVTRV